MRNLLILSFTLFAISLQAQMWNGQDTLYGNEWINFEQTYFKIPVAEDGIFRVNHTTLQANGIPLENITAGQFQVFHLGEEVPLYISTDNTIGNSDYIEFYGEKNRSEMDRYLFKNPEEEILNPYYSMFTDTSAYFLTWRETGDGLRYVEVENDLTNLPPKEEWYWHEERLVLKNRQIQKTFIDGISYSTFDKGEGFASNQSNSLDFQLSTSNIYTQTNENAQYHIRLVTSTGVAHELSLKVNNEEIINENLGSYEQKDFLFNRALTNLQATENISITGGETPNDRYATAFISLLYPRSFIFNSSNYAAFNINQNQTTQYIEIENFSDNGDNVLYNLSSQYRLITSTENGILKIKLPSATETQNLALVNTQTGWQTATLQAVNFIDYAQSNANYIIISNPLLYDDGQGNNWVQAYADYRGSNEGGNYNVVLAEIQQLYDQFSYGINRHSLSIRNFGHFVKKNWDAPKYMLLIGKGREYNDIRGSTFSNFFVPTFGRPGADNLLLASNYSQVPIFPIGRIATNSPLKIKIYLDKVKAHEDASILQATESRVWKKEIMHLGGGGDPVQQNLFKSYLDQMKFILENNDFGANTNSFFKTAASEPVQNTDQDIIYDRINKGISLLTFFGHSGTQTLDFNINSPEILENKNRYPVMLALGCLAGQFHENFTSISEKFVFLEDKGMIAFIASTGLGFSSALNPSTQTFYSKLGDNLYGKSIGEVLRSTFQAYDSWPGLAMRTLIQQTSINGDPAIVVSPFIKPDYYTELESFRISPSVIDIRQDSFDIHFTIANAGRSVNDSFYIEINRLLPDNSKLLLLRKRIPSPAYKSEYTFQFPVLGKEAIGFNKIFISLDTDEEIEETPIPTAEFNNKLFDAQGEEGISFYIFSNTVSPVYPKEFAIISDDNVQLKATSADLFALEQKYIIQIDTTTHFNSNLLQTKELVQSGGLIKWRPSNNYIDSTTYYWRVSPDSTAGQGFLWQNSSFVFIGNHESGWNQSHFFQFKESNFSRTEWPESNRKLKYQDDIKTIQVTNGVYSNEGLLPLININNDSYQYIWWGNHVRGGIYVAVFDSITASPWLNPPPGDYGSYVDGAWQDWAAYPFRTRTLDDRTSAVQFLDEIVPKGNYVLIFTIQREDIGTDYEPEEWAEDSTSLGTNLFQILEQQGATRIRSTATNGATPYVFLYKKDDPSFPVFEQLAALDEEILQTFSLQGLWNNGSIHSKAIGPANNWHDLNWKESEKEIQDETHFNLYGFKKDSIPQLLIEDLSVKDTTLNWLDASQYPYISLQYATKDTIFHTSPQLDYWRVTYEGIPEATINPYAFLSFHGDTLQQGDPLSLKFAVENISEYNMDSLLVKFKIIDQQNNIVQKQSRFKPLLQNDSLLATLMLDTKNLSGAHELIIEINPDEDQQELYHFNNVGLLNFFVEKDQRNPLLDVTFDGEHILEGDLISSKPRILILVKDENEFLALNDTSNIKIELEHPDGNIEAVYFDKPNIQFYPPNEQQLDKNNEATVAFSPQFLVDGSYRLIVKAKDATGNESSSIDYSISFEIITKSSISNVLNYPNPFTSSTKFVYTLTGDKAPEYFSIQIMTVSGRIVRTLTQDDLGYLKPGTHKTEYAWNGTDEYGDRLANGVYIYRVKIKDAAGKAWDTFENKSTDRFFDKGYGKLVILR